MNLINILKKKDSSKIEVSDKDSSLGSFINNKRKKLLINASVDIIIGENNKNANIYMENLNWQDFFEIKETENGLIIHQNERIKDYNKTLYINKNYIFFDITIKGSSNVFLKNTIAESIDLSGSSSLFINDNTSESLKINASGSSDVKIDVLNLNNTIEIKSSGSSLIDILDANFVDFNINSSGSSKVLITRKTLKNVVKEGLLNSSGSSIIKLKGIETENLKAISSGSSSIEFGEAVSIISSSKGSSEITGKCTVKKSLSQ